MAKIATTFTLATNESWTVPSGKYAVFRAYGLQADGASSCRLNINGESAADIPVRTGAGPYAVKAGDVLANAQSNCLLCISGFIYDA